MKRFAQTIVIAIAVTAISASFASADVLLPPYQDDESGYQIYQDLGGEVTAALADQETRSSSTQDAVDQELARAFDSSAYQTNPESCLMTSAANAKALEQFDELSERISFE